jgi:RIP metalloprotease RseP
MYIALAILAFGILIAVHELGHFFAAKLLDVKVNEFAIGMGPKLISKQGKETLYSLRVLPLGGFCSMEMSEEIDNLDPRDFNAKSRWKRIVILLAGGFANIIAAFIIILIVFSNATGFTGTTVTDIHENLPNEGEHMLMAGDTLVSINGDRLYYANDIGLFTQLAGLAGSGHVDLVVRRNGETFTMNNFSLMVEGVEIASIIDGFIPNLGAQELMVGDIVLSINNQPVTGNESFTTILHGLDGEPVDIVLRRNGEVVNLIDFPLRRHEYTTPDGQIEYVFGLYYAPLSVFRSLTFNHIEPTVGETLTYSLYRVMNNVRIIRVSLAMLFSGVAGIRDIGGPIAIVDSINVVGQTADTFTDAL